MAVDGLGVAYGTRERPNCRVGSLIDRAVAVKQETWQSHDYFHLMKNKKKRCCESRQPKRGAAKLPPYRGGGGGGH
jgi:hypothetical protein